MVSLPNRPLTQKDVEVLWITDRQSLLECARRHKALADFIAERDAGLRSTGKP